MWRRWTVLTAMLGMLLVELAACAAGPATPPDASGGTTVYDETQCQGPIHWC